MSQEPYYLLGRLDNTAVRVKHTITGQDILIEHSDTGQRLANVLANGQAQLVQMEGDAHWRVPHDHATDRLLVELIDLLISIRYTHPTLVQLELQLEEAGT